MIVIDGGSSAGGDLYEVIVEKLSGSRKYRTFFELDHKTILGTRDHTGMMEI